MRHPKFDMLEKSKTRLGRGDGRESAVAGTRSAVSPKQELPEEGKKKRQFIEPGSPCEPFEEHLSTTVLSENGTTTYLIAKALTGPMLQLATEFERQPKAASPPEKLPAVPAPIAGQLQPHLMGYSTVTHEGLYRSSNDDKISIVLQERAKWFAIYDGHGGSQCSLFLKEHLHEEFFVLDWKKDVVAALRTAFAKLEAAWRKKGDDSGSCALVVFIYEGTCYVANLGDSRAVLVSEAGTKCYQITKDHKPSNADEQRRVLSAGGKIYQTTALTQRTDSESKPGKAPQAAKEQKAGTLSASIMVGPLRVLPGRLSITRTFGDFEAKQDKPKVILCEPEITTFEIEEHDSIVMGSDGLWDKICNVEAAQMLKAAQSPEGPEQTLGPAASKLIQEALQRGSSDNISVIVVGLNDPDSPREPRKGNEHIKILNSISNKSRHRDKENSYPEKIKELDSRIQEINRSAARVLQQQTHS